MTVSFAVACYNTVNCTLRSTYTEFCKAAAGQLTIEQAFKRPEIPYILMSLIFYGRHPCYPQG